MFYSRLERVSQEEVRRVIDEYCKENGITELDSTFINGLSLSKVIEEITNRLISELSKDEKKNFKSAQKRGIEEARANGVVLGRPKKDIPQEFEKLYKAYRAGTITAGECAKILEIKPSAFSYLIKKYENRNK